MLEHFDTVLSFAVVMLLLSLLVTTLVQMLIAASGLRGRVLKMGLERLLVQISPDLKTHATRIADAVLCHPAIRSTAGRHATSIRKEELIQLLNDIARDTSPVLASAGAPPGTATGKVKANAEAAQAAKSALRSVLSVIQDDEFSKAAGELKDQLTKRFPAAEERVTKLAEGLLRQGGQVAAGIGSWFDLVMDRTTERFLLWTRLITVLVALVLSLCLHVDSLSIIRQLAANPELRAKLVQAADVTLKKAEGTFALTAEEKALATATIESVRAGLSNSPPAQLITNVPANLLTREAGRDWLAATLAGSTDREVILADYDKRFETNSLAWLSDLSESARDLDQTLRDPELVIIPSPTPGFDAYLTKPGHFLGTLMTVFFLSLGAPFWYNALRQLANLRPAVAQKIEPKSMVGK